MSHDFVTFQLHKIETSELQVNTFVGVRLADDLASACANTPTLFGADVLVAEGILLALMQYELRQAGLNLTHSQDKDYVRVSEHIITLIIIKVKVCVRVCVRECVRAYVRVCVRNRYRSN